MRKEQCIKGILETKDNGINEMRRRIALQNNCGQHLKDENQKKFKSGKKIQFNSRR